MARLVTFLKYDPEGKIRVEVTLAAPKIYNVHLYMKGDDPITRIVMTDKTEILVHGYWLDVLDKITTARISREDSTG